MSLWAIVPIKPLKRGKSRLSEILSDYERELLNEKLLIHTLRTLKSVSEIDHHLLVSYDPSVLSIARDYGFRTIQESKNTSINKALRRGTLAAKALKASMVIIVPADLPFLSNSAISAMIKKSLGPPEIIIAPDRMKNGTNTLFINPVGILDYDFGQWSFKKHIEQAERKKIRVEIFINEELSFDLDLPEDYEQIKKQGFIEVENLNNI